MKNILSLVGLGLGGALAMSELRAQTLTELLQALRPGQPAPASAPAAPATAAADPAPAASPALAAPPVILDTKPAFMQIVTNAYRVTNAVVVTNYVVGTKYTYTTNLFNSSGQMLQPVAPALAGVPGAIPISQAPAAAQPAKPATAAVDPAAVKAAQVKTVKELLTQSAAAAGQALSAPGTFAEGQTRSIPMPEGVTSFDRKKGQTLITAMNTAAEKAVPEAVKVLNESIQRLAMADPAAVLKGSGDAATTFLLSAEGQEVSNRVLAIVRRTAAEAGVREAHRSVMLRGGGLLGAVLGGAPAVDTDVHVTKGVVAALFSELAAQESKIRTNPSASKTKALQDALVK